MFKVHNRQDYVTYQIFYIFAPLMRFRSQHMLFVVLLLVQQAVVVHAHPPARGGMPTRWMMNAGGVLSTTNGQASLYLDTLITGKGMPEGKPSIELTNPSVFKYAIWLDRAVEEVSGLPILHYLEEWVGVPYLFGGNTKKGVDCSSFVQQLVYTLHNIPISRMVKTQFEECRAVMRDELKEGDLIFFHTTRPGLSHVGYYLGNNKFVHASSTRGVIVDDLRSPYYTKAFRYGGRIILEKSQAASSSNE